MTPCEPPSGGWAVVDAATRRDEAMQRALADAAAEPDYGGAWVDQSINPASDDGHGGRDSNDPTKLVLNVMFTGDLERHEAELRAVWGGPLCVSSAPRSQGRAARDPGRPDRASPACSAATPNDRAGTLEVSVVIDDGLQARMDRPTARRRRGDPSLSAGGLTPGSRSARARKARPRWLIASFSSGVHLGGRSVLAGRARRSGRSRSRSSRAAALASEPASTPSATTLGSVGRDERCGADELGAASVVGQVVELGEQELRGWRRRRRAGRPTAPSGRRACRSARRRRARSRPAIAGEAGRRATARALINAFSANVEPVSAMSGRSGATSSRPTTTRPGARTARMRPTSTTLCGLRDASTTGRGVRVHASCKRPRRAPSSVGHVRDTARSRCRWPCRRRARQIRRPPS